MYIASIFVMCVVCIDGSPTEVNTEFMTVEDGKEYIVNEGVTITGLRCVTPGEKGYNANRNCAVFWRKLGDTSVKTKTSNNLIFHQPFVKEYAGKYSCIQGTRQKTITINRQCVVDLKNEFATDSNDIRLDVLNTLYDNTFRNDEYEIDLDVVDFEHPGSDTNSGSEEIKKIDLSYRKEGMSHQPESMYNVVKITRHIELPEVHEVTFKPLKGDMYDLEYTMTFQDLQIKAEFIIPCEGPDRRATFRIITITQGELSPVTYTTGYVKKVKNALGYDSAYKEYKEQEAKLMRYVQEAIESVVQIKIDISQNRAINATQCMAKVRKLGDNDVQDARAMWEYLYGHRCNPRSNERYQMQFLLAPSILSAYSRVKARIYSYYRKVINFGNRAEVVFAPFAKQLTVQTRNIGLTKPLILLEMLQKAASTDEKKECEVQLETLNVNMEFTQYCDSECRMEAKVSVKHHGFRNFWNDCPWGVDEKSIMENISKEIKDIIDVKVKENNKQCLRNLKAI